jgi:hypothetical protein
MAIPSTGAISLTTVQTEFGGSNPTSLSEYYAGGAYVPAGTSGTYGAVPSSGTISLRNFYGTSAVLISITNQNLSGFTDEPDVSETIYSIGDTFGQDGKVYGDSTYGGYVQLEQWCTPTSAASDYEAFATIVSGSLASGQTLTWLSLNATRQWTVSEASSGNSQICTFTVQIRRIGTTTVLDTATITIEAGVF